MKPCTAPQNTSSELADDILEGADAIGDFLFGSSSDERKRKRNRRKVYYLAESTKLPIFRLGTMLSARKSVLLKYVTNQEDRAFAAMEEATIARSVP